jgi:hypothetical protein
MRTATFSCSCMCCEGRLGTNANSLGKMAHLKTGASDRRKKRQAPRLSLTLDVEGARWLLKLIVELGKKWQRRATDEANRQIYSGI